MIRDLDADREEMVRTQIEARGVVDPSLLRAMRTIPRHFFVHENLRGIAYEDEPLPIGGRQTISQPFIVAFMTEALALKPSDKVLEVGTGSGYQTAVLADLAAEVLTVEIIPELAASARAVLSRLGYANIRFRTGDGAEGWPEEAPFDAVIVTAASVRVPDALTGQLAEGGRMIIPVGRDRQTLRLIRKKDGRLIETALLRVRFVPLTAGAPGGTS